MPRQVETEEGRNTNHPDSDLAKQIRTAESHHQRPNQVELFLDSEGPGDTQESCGHGRNRHEEILEKQRIGPPGLRARFEYDLGFGWTQKRNNHKHEKKGRVI